MEEGTTTEGLLGPTQQMARDIGLRGVLKLWALGSLLGLAVTLAYLTQPAESTVYIATAENATFSFADADAAFGGLIPPNGLRGVLRRSVPQNGCGGLEISATPGGVEFALIERGGCTFDEKVRNAQSAGFAAAVIFNNEPGRELITMSGRRTGEIYIPAVFVTYNSGRQLLAIIEQPGTVCYISSTFENTAWSVMAVSFISLLAVSAVLATFFFVRRHRLRRIGSRLILVRAEDAGMTAREVKALPSFTFSAATPGSGTSETCAICLEDYEVGEKLRVLPCRHEFHLACVDQWLTTRRPFCPVCKRDAHVSNSTPPPSENTPLLAPLLRPPSVVRGPPSRLTPPSVAQTTPPHATVQIEDFESTGGAVSGEVTRPGGVGVRPENRVQTRPESGAVAGPEGRDQVRPETEATGLSEGSGERPGLVAAATQTVSTSP